MKIALSFLSQYDREEIENINPWFKQFYFIANIPGKKNKRASQAKEFMMMNYLFSNFILNNNHK